MNPGPTEFVLAAPVADPPAVVWSNLDMPAIKAALLETGVWAPADQQAGLTALVKQAAENGDNLHVVVLEQSYPKFTAYRDIATEIQSQVGGTVLVFGPSGNGTASDEFSRVELEDSANDISKGANATQAATQMYNKAIDPNVDWTGVTIGLIVVVVIGAVLARVMMKRRRGADVAEPDGGRSAAGATAQTSEPIADTEAEGGADEQS
ncbi:DUF6676 family protein [Gordonia sp. (in: high G+C Gram-positive bacteria)]|mgnify:CR=1 FL=1|uniref:Rv1476 family membrane protein n=1 Tax=Gordonia sp. (in: high G+C Gram-positive bacteria) TaxID=84139 RepID=UPI0025C1954A|nr:DUF6676 family protein [Gordonia sp. (in: high G+C Gram-positive bacteria)]